ncbi:hypothetical protein CPAR01_04330 [Colletotrichum paranaense]|uniref:Uncharacterized protein n=1 Tax=Colletotrichum paranaense TaxID=1914294 RepID=A0ABQ9SX70_9PEZI|nr:uncharacterized protein CPAR01_04330 [Colletotrichum paranaense]KAK1543697.1 hypothetical protein CPAR01_04330 [Colletotrichum paranaense]
MHHARNGTSQQEYARWQAVRICHFWQLQKGYATLICNSILASSERLLDGTDRVLFLTRRTAHGLIKHWIHALILRQGPESYVHQAAMSFSCRGPRRRPPNLRTELSSHYGRASFKEFAGTSRRRQKVRIFLMHNRWVWKAERSRRPGTRRRSDTCAHHQIHRQHPSKSCVHGTCPSIHFASPVDWHWPHFDNSLVSLVVRLKYVALDGCVPECLLLRPLRASPSSTGLDVVAAVDMVRSVSWLLQPSCRRGARTSSLLHRDLAFPSCTELRARVRGFLATEA